MTVWLVYETADTVHDPKSEDVLMSVCYTKALADAVSDSLAVATGCSYHVSESVVVTEFNDTQAGD